MTTTAIFVAEMMEDSKQRALTKTFERLLSSQEIELIWPAAFDRKKGNNPIPLNEIKIVVLPLDRIGAPAGASGASVYIAYYSHAPASPDNTLLASPPVVVKIGEASSLKEEKDQADNLPTLQQRAKERFARPYYLDTSDPEWAVLIAPFQSNFDAVDGGTRNTIELKDLWRLLGCKDELSGADDAHWVKIKKCINEALDAVHSLHQGAHAELKSAKQPYKKLYYKYLRHTTGSDKRCHIPKLIFGSDSELEAFGKTWANPVLLVEKLISGREFSGRIGAIHGDLHPKNIVINHDDVARIIDFGWAQNESHIVQDYLLLDLNIRSMTLPSQMPQTDVLALAGFLNPLQDANALSDSIQPRAKIIKDVIWEKAKKRAICDWEEEYLIPLLLVGYGLLVHLDDARNQMALVATVLAITNVISEKERYS